MTGTAVFLPDTLCALDMGLVAASYPVPIGQGRVVIRAELRGILLPGIVTERQESACPSAIS